MNVTSENFEFNSQNPLQIYTLAHAVRPSKKSLVDIVNERKSKKPLGNNISRQVNQSLTMKYETTIKCQSRSRLPLNMIVSKMATRTPIQGPDQENEDPYGDLDISLCRKVKLAPPSWRNRSYETKRLKPSGFKKIVDSMKERCSYFDVNMQQDPIISSQTTSDSDLNNLLVSVASGYDTMITPRLEHNYNRLYGKQQEQRSPVKCRDEDPLPAACEYQHSESWPAELSDIRSRPSPHENFEFDPRYSPRPQAPTEFVWDPVIVTEQTQTERLFSPVRDKTREYHHPHFEASWPTRSHVSGYCKDRFMPSSPFSPGNCETSSTSSDQTIAEERLQFTYYAKRGRSSQFGSNLRQPRDQTRQETSRVTSLWADDEPAFLKFLEE
uniref:Uncharacterized protein n=1 Tax=Graphocephala atropunctata TaxID=36148 RepID=A0A1B6KF93_9HEMI